MSQAKLHFITERSVTVFIEIDVVMSHTISGPLGNGNMGLKEAPGM